MNKWSTTHSNSPLPPTLHLMVQQRDLLKHLRKPCKKNKCKGVSFHDQLMHFLLTYRVTPHATTGVAPCELFMGRHLCTSLDLLRPDLESIVAKKQFEQKGHHDGAATLRQFVEGQWVLVRNFRKGPKWVPAIVRQKSGPLSYVVQLTPTISWRRHVDQMRVCSDSPYWHETVASSPTDKSGVPAEVEKRPM